MDTPVRELTDRLEIADLSARYCYALDRNDWDEVMCCVSDEPVFAHPGGRVEGTHGIIARARGALEALDPSQHLLGNVTVGIDATGADAADPRSYFQAHHIRAGTPAGDTYIIAGSYADRVVRTPSGWRIAERVQAYLWRDGNRAVVAR